MSVIPRVGGRHTCKHNHTHNPVTRFTCSAASPAHLDRKDVCSVSRVHGKQLLVVQRVPHNRVLVIRTRGQQAASRDRQQFWPLLKFRYPVCPGRKGLRPHTTLRTIVRVIEYKIILETVIDSLLFCSEDFSLFLKCISLSKKQSLEGHPTFHLSGIYYLTLCCCWWMKLKDTAENSNMAEIRGPNSSFGSTHVLRSTKKKENPPPPNLSTSFSSTCRCRISYLLSFLVPLQTVDTSWVTLGDKKRANQKFSWRTQCQEVEVNR